MVDYESDKARYWRACDVWTFNEVLFLLNGEWPNGDRNPPSSLNIDLLECLNETVHDMGDDGFLTFQETENQVLNPVPDGVPLRQIVEDAVAAGSLTPLSFHGSPKYKRDFELRFRPGEVIAWATSRGCFPDFPFSETDADMGNPAHPTRAVAFVVADSTSNAPAPSPTKQAPNRTTTREKRPAWLEVAGPYITEVMRAGQYATGKELFNALEERAGPDSPFDKGQGGNRGDLFVREIAKTVTLKTMQNQFSKLRKMVQNTAP